MRLPFKVLNQHAQDLGQPDRLPTQYSPVRPGIESLFVDGLEPNATKPPSPQIVVKRRRLVNLNPGNEGEPAAKLDAGEHKPPLTPEQPAAAIERRVHRIVKPVAPPTVQDSGSEPAQTTGATELTSLPQGLRAAKQAARKPRFSRVEHHAVTQPPPPEQAPADEATVPLAQWDFMAPHRRHQAQREKLLADLRTLQLRLNKLRNGPELPDFLRETSV